MGYIAHHAIVATFYRDGEATAARDKAIALGCSCFLSEPQVNGYRTLVIFPDGSKEGWPASSDGDNRRSAFVEWLSEPARYCEWAEVRYSGDDGEARVTRDAWHGPPRAGKEDE